MPGTYFVSGSALPRGAKIGPSANFAPAALIEDSFTGGPSNLRHLYGRWGGNLKDRYLGVSFLINGQTHYGWIRLTVTTQPQKNAPFMSATITGYAYETVANKTIFAGTAAGSASTTAGVGQTPTAEGPAPKSIRDHSVASLGMLAAGAEGLPLWRREDQ